MRDGETEVEDKSDGDENVINRVEESEKDKHSS
jgi:hypothetical protein